MKMATPIHPEALHPIRGHTISILVVSMEGASDVVGVGMNGVSVVELVVAPETDGVVTVPVVVALTVGGSAVVTVSARVAILVELTLVVGCDSVEFTTSPTNTSPEPKESSMMKTSSSVMGAVIVESSSWCISKHSDK